MTSRPEWAFVKNVDAMRERNSGERPKMHMLNPDAKPGCAGNALEAAKRDEKQLFGGEEHLGMNHSTRWSLRSREDGPKAVQQEEECKSVGRR